MNPIFKKTEPSENLKNLVRELTRTKMKVEFNYENLQEQIKESYRANRKPSPAVLQGWVTAKNLLSFMDNQIAGFQNQLMLFDLGNSIKEALGVTKISQIEESLNKINLKVTGIDSLMDQFSGIQMDSMYNMKELSVQMEQNSSVMGRIVGDLGKQAEQQIGNEFLKEMKNNDPDFFDSIPENVKNKII